MKECCNFDRARQQKNGEEEEEEEEEEEACSIRYLDYVLSSKL